MALVNSLRNTLTMAAMIRMTTITSVNCSHRICHRLLTPRSSNSLRPYLSSRAAASPACSPLSGCVSSSARASSAVF